MKKCSKYAFSQYLYWLGLFATVLGVVALLSIGQCLSRIIVVSCFVLAFIIPFLEAVFKNKFKLKTVGKSNITFKFGDLFNEECFVITTNRNFDVNPTGEYISEDSLIGEFVEKFFPDNVSELEGLIREQLNKINNHNDTGIYEYGTCIKISLGRKVVYFMAFTDRNKENQPDNFYENAIQTFFASIKNENHGKTIAVPLLGDNSNLSNSGFTNTEISFKSLITMINCFEIANQRSELKLKIVALPETRTDIISCVKAYSE